MSNPHKQSVKITFTSPGAQPPVYVSGAFTLLPWEPQEMEYEIVAPTSHEGHSDPIEDEHALTEYRFFKDFEVTEGRWHYKFRLGPGDWWVCDEAKETVTDEDGNRNNLLVVQPTHHVDYTHVHKHVHARPLRRNDGSSTAWEVVEADIAPCNTPADQHHHHSTSESLREDSSKPIHGSETTSVRVVPVFVTSKDQRHGPLPTRSQATSGESSIPTFEVNTPDDVGKGSADLDTERYGDRKMSTVDIEKVKLLMSMPNPSGTSPTVLATQDGHVFAIDQENKAIPHSPVRSAVNMNSRAPLLSHECLTCDFGTQHTTVEEGIDQGRNHSNSSPDSPDGPPTPDDFDSPLLEIFPTGARNILQRIATLQKEIPPDGAAGFDEDDPFSPAPLTKDAPTFPHELPPIGSPAATQRRKYSSEDSPEISKLGDGATDSRSPSNSPQTLPPSAIALDDPSRRYLRPDTPNSDHADNATQPLLSVQDALKAPATYGTSSHSSPPSIATEGARLRNAKAADLISSTEDSSYTSDGEVEPSQSLWQKLLAWFAELWVRLRGRTGVDQ